MAVEHIEIFSRLTKLSISVTRLKELNIQPVEVNHHEPKLKKMLVPLEGEFFCLEASITFINVFSQIKWDCDDGWNAGSICQKSCSNPSHIMTSGNPRMICHCSENDEGVFGCDWKITQENPNPGYSTHLSYTDSADCIGACNGNSKVNELNCPLSLTVSPI